MKMLKAIPLLASVFIASAANAAAPILNLDSKNKIKDEYIVVFKDKATNVEAFSRALNGGNAKVLKSFSNALRASVIEVPESALKGIANNPNVAFIEANVVHENAFSSVASWGVGQNRPRQSATRQFLFT